MKLDFKNLKKRNMLKEIEDDFGNRDSNGN